MALELEVRKVAYFPKCHPHFRQRERDRSNGTVSYDFYFLFIYLFFICSEFCHTLK